MIIDTWKPKIKYFNKKRCILYYMKCDYGDIYKAGSSNIKVTYKCDCEVCKNPNKIYAIDRQHLTEKRSKTVNEKIQICRSCQMSGIKNPRYGDNRKWVDIFGKDKTMQLKMKMSGRFLGDNNPSKSEMVKNKKKQFIINFINVDNFLKKYGFTLKSIDGDNKYSILSIICSKGHEFKIQWSGFKCRKICRYCYYESIRIPLEKIEEFNIYSKKVRYLTRSGFLKNKKLIDGYEMKERDSKKYHIDHIYSISDGFLNKIDPEIISSYINLRVISKISNLEKGKKSDISIDELMEKYKAIF